VFLLLLLSNHHFSIKQVLRRFAKAKVDIVERLPTPFGLVRSGVAPDHPETKVWNFNFCFLQKERLGFAAMINLH
jgi:adrenodoxin-NADP+ reductase